MGAENGISTELERKIAKISTDLRWLDGKIGVHQSLEILLEALFDRNQELAEVLPQHEYRDLYLFYLSAGSEIERRYCQDVDVYPGSIEEEEDWLRVEQWLRELAPKDHEFTFFHMGDRAYWGYRTHPLSFEEDQGQID